YAPELLGEPFTESEVWPSLRPKVLEDLERVGLKAWSVRNSCPIEQLDPDELELNDHVIVTERLNRGELPRFDKYDLPVHNPWAFIGIVPETGYTPPKPSWWEIGRASGRERGQHREV